MIASMTGFGRGTAHAHNITATVEMRSVNNRFIDISVRMPSRLIAYETEIQNRLKKAFERGRFTVQIQVEQAATDALPVQVNHAAARAYGQLLEELRQAAGLQEPVRLEDLLRQNDVFETASEKPEVTEQMAEVVYAALAEAIRGMRQMRQDEGQALAADLTARINAIEQYVVFVEARAPQRVDEARTRLRERIEEWLGDDRLDPERLEQEITILADKLDVTEECVRLRSHLAQFREALANDEAVGRKLNFLVQEIHREVNTIGSKANDAEVGRYAIEMKEEVEKIREQVQNVE